MPIRVTKKFEMHRDDVSVNEANNDAHYGYQDWRLPTLAEMTVIAEKVRNSGLSQKITKSFNPNAMYLTAGGEDLTYTVSTKDGSKSYIGRKGDNGAAITMRPVRTLR